jgi:acyl-CoA dehydrogenase
MQRGKASLMDFALTDAQQQIRDEVLRVCARFDDTYWLERENTATFPHAFFDAMAAGQWLGIAMPEAYGGAGLGCKRHPHQHFRAEPGGRLRH